VDGEAPGRALKRFFAHWLRDVIPSVSGPPRALYADWRGMQWWGRGEGEEPGRLVSRPGARRWDPASPARFMELFLCSA